MTKHMPVADRLREKRGDISQSELARISEVSQKTISAIELGRIKSPTYQTAVKLADALDCNYELFLDAADAQVTKRRRSGKEEPEKVDLLQMVKQRLLKMGEMK